MARVASNLKTSEMMRRGITPETVNALGTLWRSRFEELTARAQEQGAGIRDIQCVFCFQSRCLKYFTSGAEVGESEQATHVPDAAYDHHLRGAAAASPNSSAADWFDGDNYDQTDGFGDERGDLARNVRAKHDAGA